MGRFINPVPQYSGDDKEPLIDGKLFFFESGSATLKDVFADVNESIPLSNPVILSGAGRVPNIFYSGSARVKLTDSDEVQIYDRDPVETSSSGQGGFPDWNSVSIWNIPDVVVGGDERFYISLTNGNQGNDPTTSPLNWSEIKFTGVFNVNETYEIADIVQASDGLLYVSKSNGNLNNDPLTDVVNWGPASNNADTTIQAYAFFIGVN